MFFIVFLAEFFFLFLSSKLIIRNISTFIYRLTRSRKITAWILSIIFLPGTVVHELSHYFCASFLFVKVGRISFLPKITDKDRVIMGSVEIGKTDPIRRAIIGFAPVVIGVLIISGAVLLFKNNLLQELFSPSSFSEYAILFGLAYLVFVIGNTMFSSSKDVEGTVEILAVLILIIFALSFAGINMGVFIDLVVSQEELIKQFIIFLAPLVGIDILFLAAGILVKIR